MNRVKTFHFTPATLALDWKRIAGKIEGLNAGTHADLKTAVFNRAKEKLVSAVRPAGLLKSLSTETFASVYTGQGRNEHPAPLEAIYQLADHLALYIVTLGQGVGRAMSELTEAGEMTAAYMLDIIASEVTEAAADALQARFEKQLTDRNAFDPQAKVLRYSPGYCGWHISAQKKIFEILKPERIGVHLGSGFSMNPLKSNSGVMVCGPERIHRFRNNFTFCMACKTHNCRARIKQLEE